VNRVGGLFDQFCSFRNLLAAYQKARRGTRKNHATSEFFLNLEYELFEIQESLTQMTYYPEDYQYFQIYDPKERTISVAPFRDRVVHHALVNVLEPIYERCFIYDSYATRKGKGTHKALRQAQRYLKRTGWFFKTDISKYFDSIRHDVLMEILSSKIKDKQILEITDRIIRNGGTDGVGLPIGNLTSQFFANVYLNKFDHFVKQELRFKEYIRYMDDFVLFSSDKERLKGARSDLEAYLKEQLSLSLKPSGTYINSSTNGLTFLGRRVFPATLRVAPENLKRMLKRMQACESNYLSGEMDESSFLQTMNSYWSILQHGDTLGLRKKLVSCEGFTLGERRPWL
jgi:RNA-directed DNA polymerase